MCNGGQPPNMGQLPQEQNDDADAPPEVPT
jgi:hypothetical protein